MMFYNQPMPNTKPQMLKLIKQLHDTATEENFKVAPEIFSFVLFTVNYSGLEVGCNAIEPIQSKITAIHGLPSSTTKIELMMFIASMNFYSKFIDKLHVNMNSLFDSLPDNIEFHWNKELGTLSQQMKTLITEDVTMTPPNTNYPLFFCCGLFLNCYRLYQFLKEEKNCTFFL